MRKIRLFLNFFIVSVFLFSCATSIPITTTKPPQAKYKGAKIVGVLPTGFSGESVLGELRKGTYFSSYQRRELSDELRVAKYTTSKIEELLASANYFTVISSAQLGSDNNGKAAAEVYVLATLSPISESTDSEYIEETNKDGDITDSYYLYTRYCHIEIVFQIINSTTYEIQDSFSVLGTAESEGRDQDRLESFPTLRNSAVNTALKYAAPQLIPITTTTYVYMKKMATKDKDFIEKVDSLVDSKFYQEAYNAYMDYYRSSGDKAAEYNAILLLEPLDKLDEAIKRMEAYAKETGDKDAFRAYERLKQTKADRESL